jgi:uncharacterized protein YpmS
LKLVRSSTTDAATATSLPGVVLAFLLLLLSGFAVHAAAPVMTLPATVTIPEDEATNLVFSVTDVDSPLFTVTITARSSDTTLVPNSGLVVSGAGSTRFLAITPGLHKYGTATITVIATDDNLESSTNTFTLNVTYTNYPPAFTSVVTNRTIREDAGSTNLTFAISDVETALSNLTVTATSTNTTLVPNGNLILSGTTANRTLNLTPATNLFGTSLISIVVTDGGSASVTNNFLLTVLSVNDAPTFSLSTNRIDQLEDAGLTTVSNFLTGIASGPANESSQSNWLVLNYTTNFFAQEPAVDGSGTLTFQVATNANGTNNITFILADDGGTANGGRDRSTNILTLAVASVNDLPVFTTNITDLTINEDAGRTNLSYSIFDADHSLAALTITATSTNTSLVPTNGFIFTGTSSNRTVGITTLTNAFGTTEISLVVTDPAGGAATNKFVLTVNSVPDAPILGGATNRTFLEDAPASLSGVISLYDADTAVTNVGVTVTSSDTNLVTVAITDTNVISASSLALTLDYTLKTNANGSATIAVIANDGLVSVTNSYTVTVTAVNDQPAFALSTNLVVVAEDAGTITNASFLTGISPGPGNETNQTWTFTVTSGTNFGYATAPAINSTGTLTFRTATNAFGTNVITVVMKDSGGTSNGGVDSLTNTFTLAVTPVNDAPYFTGVTPRTILEDSTTNTAVVNVIDVDTDNTNVTVTVASSDTNLVAVTLVATNSIGLTNSAMTLAFAPVANANGSATISLIANDGAVSTTNSFTLNVTAVNDQPDFAVSTNLVLVAEDAGTITNASFLTGISTGPGNETNQTWAFTVTSGTNFAYATAPAISTNGTLTFRAATNAFGTNLISVVMKDSGGTANGGVDAITNTFSIGVTPVNDAPYFTGITSRSILEDATTNNTAVVNVVDVDTANTSVSVTVASSDTNLVTVALTATNSIGTTNSALTLTFAPGADANGSATITLIANDGALMTTNSFVLTVTPVNDQPAFAVSTNLLIVAENAGTITNLNFLTSLSTGPTNEASQTWTFTVTSGTNFGYALAPAISTNGTLTFRTATNAFGTNLITVVMKDSGGTAGGGVDSYTNTFTLGVTPVNNAPYFTGVGARSILEDATTNNTAVVNVIDVDTLNTSVVVTVSSSDTNLVAVALTATNSIGTTNAALTLTFAPVTNANGTATITLIADDGALTTTNSFVLTVTAVNDQPNFAVSTNLVVAAEDAGTITNLNFLTGISPGPANEASQTWTFTLTSGTNFSYATLPAISTNGTLTFRTATNAVGTNLITVVMKDSGGVANGGRDSITNTFSLAVTPVNDAPYFTGIASRTILEDATTNNTAVVNVIDIDTASSNVVVTVSSSDTNLATVAITGTNVLSGTNSALTLTFTPQPNANGSLSITLIADDGALTTTNSFLLTVTAVNDQPSFTLSTNLLIVAEGAGIVTNASFVTGISTGPTNEANQTWTFTVTSGTNFAYALAPAISTNGTLTFRTATNAFGTNLITVVLKDSGGVANGGKDTITNTFTLGVTPVNDAPYFTGITSRTILEDATTNVTAIVNVVDADTASSNLVVTVSASDTNLATVAITGTNYLSATNAALTLTFTPQPNANGSLSVTLIANDGALSTTNSFLLTVTAVNDQPSFAVSTNLVVVAEDAGVITNLNFLTSISTGPTNEANQVWTFTVTSGTNFAYALAPTISTNGTLTFRTATNSFGTNLITVVMKDNGGTANGGKDSVTNTFSLGITPVNNAPYFTGLATRTILEDAGTNNTAVINVVDVDTASTNVSVTVSSSDTNLATVAITGTNVVSATNSALTLTFTPQTNAYGSAVITLIANDGALTQTNSFLLNVTAVNDQPAFAVSTNLVVVPEDGGTITNLNFLTGISTGPTNEANQTWTFTVTSGTNFAYALAPTISTNGTLTFRTATNLFGTNLITVVMKDSGGTANGGRDSVTNTFTLGVTPVNDAPYFTGLVTRTILEDAVTNNTAVVNVVDVDTLNTSVVVSVASANTNLVTVALTATNSIGATNSALTLTFTPQPDAAGSTTITLIADDGALTTTNSFVLNVTPVNDPPAFAVSTNLVVVAEDAGTITNLNFLTSISTGPTNEASQTWVFTVTSGTNFTYALAPAISTNGTLTFRTATNAVGTNLITVVMKDNGGTTGGGQDSVTNTFTLAVTPVNDAPFFAGLVSRTIREDTTVSNTAVINVLDLDTAITNVSVTVRSSDTNIADVAITATNLVNGTNAALTLTFTPKTNANGSLSITLIADDGALTTTNSFLLTVTPVNDQPAFAVSTNLLLVAEGAGFVTNASFVTGISTGPTNEANQSYAFAVTSGTNFSYALAPIITTNGILIFRTATNAFGTNLITVVMKDNGGVANGGVDSYTNTFTLGVTPVNDAPFFTGLASRTIREDTTVSNTAVINVLDSDTAITNVSVTVSSSDTNIADVAITSTNLISLTNAALTLTFTPKTNANGSLSITLIATDGVLSTTNSFLLTVAAVNDAPSFTLSTNLVLIAEDAGAITNASFVTGLSAGPSNEVNQTWAFTVSSGTNFTYATPPTISTNGTLTFRAATNAVGTNLITIVLKDNGGTANGGVDSVTNTFTIAVTPVNDAPYFTGLVTKTILEDATTNLTSVINVIDVDTASTNVTVTVSSSDTNLATVIITSTNVLSGTNTQLTLTYAPKTNANGSATITLIADDGALATTNSFLLNVTPVNDVPSFNLALSALTVDKYNVAVSVANAVTNIYAGAFNETNQIVSFVMSNSNSGLFTAQPAIGTNGTLTFTPGARGGTVTVTVRARDNGGAANGGVDTSAAQTFTITVPPNPFVALGGTYAGLFFDTNALANDSSGYFRLALATNGVFSGHILRAGTSNVFSGQFNPASPTLSLAVSNTPCVLTFTLDTGGSWTETISGTVSNTTAGWSANLLSFLNVNAGGFPAAFGGEYLVAIPGNASAAAGPPGDGTLAVTIANNGVVTLSGYLADDTFVRQATIISRNGSVPFYVGLGATGSASGWLTFKATGTSHLQSDSEVVFIRGAGAPYYPAGFTNATVALGSFYNATAQDLLTMSSGSVVLSGGGLAAPITTTYTLANNVITVDPAATNGLALTIFRNTGQVSGTFNAGGQAAEINSVILQSTNVARGYFALPGGVGKFILY